MLSQFGTLVVCIVCLSSLQWANGVVNVNLSAVGYNFATSISIDNEIFGTIVNTGDYDLITYNRSATYNASEGLKICRLAYVDNGKQVDYYSCEQQRSNLGISTAKALTNITSTQFQTEQLPDLQKWSNASGTLGMNYCQGCDPTAFQQLVFNASGTNTSLPFGLDLRGSNAAMYSDGVTQSSMQLGGLSPAFESSIQWFSQASSDPNFHSFVMSDFQFCGNLPLGNFSTSWPAIVNTGAVCLAFPDDIYGSFAAWFDNSTVFEGASSLPMLQFTVGNGLSSSNSAVMYLPLESLLVDTDALDHLPGGPWVSVRDTVSGVVSQHRLCVVQGGTIMTSYIGSARLYSDPPPPIVFGSLAMQSFYFAADFADSKMGLASKISAQYISANQAASPSTPGQGGCSAVRTCEGDQTYSPPQNTCDNPSCSRFYFTDFNDANKRCEFRTSTVVGGLIFIALIAALEVTSYFVTQYSAWAALDGAIAERGGRRRVDPLTKFVGHWLAKPVDLLVMYVLGWAPPPLGPMGAGGGGGGGGGAVATAPAPPTTQAQPVNHFQVNPQRQAPRQEGFHERNGGYH